MLAQGSSVSKADLEQLILEMDAKAHESETRIRAWLQSTDERRRIARESCRANADVGGTCALSLRESVLTFLAGDSGGAMRLARRALDDAGATAPPTLKALILTQVSACSRALGDLRGALQTVRRAEAFLSCEVGDASPQMLLVRHQLVDLIRRSGMTDQLAVERLTRTFRGLLQLATDDTSRAGLSRLVHVLEGSTPPPHWALCFCKRWSN
jgi:hypothetical protein